MTEWHIEGEWCKNCNCDPGGPCDFNQRPTKGFCQGMSAMRITKGRFGEVDLAGVIWGAIVRWPGALHEGNGEMQPFVDSAASEEQVGAIFELASGRHGDTFMEVVSVICPTVHEPLIAPVKWEFDIENRHGRLRVGTALEADVESLRGIDPPSPYRVLVRIPNGMEYTGSNHEAETALAKHIIARGAIDFEITPLKRVCLRHCRSPLHYVLGGWRNGKMGAVLMGVEHGAYCVGCCWGLMLILFAIGVMSIIAMLVIAGLIFAEKVLPFGNRLTPVFAVMFIGAGIWIAAAPSTFPGLTHPTSASSMHM